MAQWLYHLLSSKYHIEISNDRIKYYYIKKYYIKKNKQIIYMNELTKCPICNESDINIQTNCGHSYCLSCISEWHNKSKSSKCPMCRQKITLYYNVLKK